MRFSFFSCSCFIGETAVFFGAFLGPIIAILLFNFVIFFIVIFVLIRHTIGRINRKGDKLDKGTAFRLLISISGVMFLFGLTWLFGAFTIADASFAFQLLFTIFNSLQGFFIFVFFCVLSKDAREAWIGLLSCGRYKTGEFRPSQPKYTSGTTPTKKSTGNTGLSTQAFSSSKALQSEYEMPEVKKDASEFEKTDLESGTSTFKRENPEPGVADTEGAAVATVELEQAVPGRKEKEEKGQERNGHELKARIQRYSTKCVGKHHVEKYEVDFDVEEEGDEFAAHA